MYKYVFFLMILFSSLANRVEAEQNDSMIGISYSNILVLSTYAGDEPQAIGFEGFLIGVEHFESFPNRRILGLRSSIGLGFPYRGPYSGGIAQIQEGGLWDGWTTTYRTYSEAELQFFVRGTFGPGFRLINAMRWQLILSPLLGGELIYVEWPKDENGRITTEPFSVTATNIGIGADVFGAFIIQRRIALFVGFDLGMHAYTRLRFRYSDEDSILNGPYDSDIASGFQRAYFGIGSKY
ncbi:MAG: hypothetical protein PF508_16840 [Spirochaeta sp.]|jgi:hypothetical protein|nr:hypothetical protein [Spirochaeta sp.]